MKDGFTRTLGFTPADNGQTTPTFEASERHNTNFTPPLFKFLTPADVAKAHTHSITSIGSFYHALALPLQGMPCLIVTAFNYGKKKCIVMQSTLIH